MYFHEQYIILRYVKHMTMTDCNIERFIVILIQQFTNNKSTIIFKESIPQFWPFSYLLSYCIEIIFDPRYFHVFFVVFFLDCFFRVNLYIFTNYEILSRFSNLWMRAWNMAHCILKTIFYKCSLADFSFLSWVFWIYLYFFLWKLQTIK